MNCSHFTKSFIVNNHQDSGLSKGESLGWCRRRLSCLTGLSLHSKLISTPMYCLVFRRFRLFLRRLLLLMPNMLQEIEEWFLVHASLRLKITSLQTLRYALSFINSISNFFSLINELNLVIHGCWWDLKWIFWWYWVHLVL